MGRPRTPEHKKRNRRVVFYISAEEYADLADSAKAHGGISVFVRRIVMEHLERKGRRLFGLL